jgi:hypothetical protein
LPVAALPVAALLSCPALLPQTWSGKQENWDAAQNILVALAKANSEAQLGQFKGPHPVPGGSWGGGGLGGGGGGQHWGGVMGWPEPTDIVFRTVKLVDVWRMCHGAWVVHETGQHLRCAAVLSAGFGAECRPSYYLPYQLQGGKGPSVCLLALLTCTLLLLGWVATAAGGGRILQALRTGGAGK